MNVHQNACTQDLPRKNPRLATACPRSRPRHIANLPKSWSPPGSDMRHAA